MVKRKFLFFSTSSKDGDVFRCIQCNLQTLISSFSPPSVCFFFFFTHSFSALHHAALTGTTELLSLLLDSQATVDIKDINGIKTTEQPHRPTSHRFWRDIRLNT